MEKYFLGPHKGRKNEVLQRRKGGAGRKEKPKGLRQVEAYGKGGTGKIQRPEISCTERGFQKGEGGVSAGNKFGGMFFASKG